MRALVAFLLVSTFVAGQAPLEVSSVLHEGARLVGTNQLAAAQDLYEKALHEFPENPDLRYELGMVFFRQHEWPQAIDNYRRSLSSRPGQVKALFYLAESYYMESDMDRALSTVAEAARIAPEDAQICQKYGEYLSGTLDTRKDGLSWLEKARRWNPNLARIDFEIGKTEFDLTDFQAAASDFAEALKRNSEDGESAYYLGESWANLGDWTKARDAYNYALSHEYAKGPVYYGLGRSYVELGQFDAAVDPLKRAIATAPSLINAHFQLAKAYRQLGRSKDANKETVLFTAMTDRVDTSRGLNGPDEEEAWKQVKPLLEANKEREALDLLTKFPAAEIRDQGGPLYLLGVMYYSMRRTKDAERVLTTARAKFPQSAPIAAYLGMVQLSNGEVSVADASFRSALALDSNQALALIGMGAIRYQQQRWPESIEYLERSRTADPNVLLMLCDAYYRVGKPDQAALTAEVIRALGAGRQPLLDRLANLVSLNQNKQPQTP